MRAVWWRSTWGRSIAVRHTVGMLDPLRVSLRTQPFLSGGTPAYADYIVFSLLQWARIVSDFHLIEATDPIAAWRERMLDLHDGLARREAGRGGRK